MKKMKAGMTIFVFIVATILVAWVVKNHGHNPFTQPVVRISIVDGQCLSITKIENYKEVVDKSCKDYERLKKEGGYILREVPPEGWRPTK